MSLWLMVEQALLSLLFVLCIIPRRLVLSFAVFWTSVVNVVAAESSLKFLWWLLFLEPGCNHTCRRLLMWVLIILDRLKSLSFLESSTVGAVCSPVSSPELFQLKWLILRILCHLLAVFGGSTIIVAFGRASSTATMVQTLLLRKGSCWKLLSASISCR